MKQFQTLIKISLVSGLLFTSQMVHAGTLENLERERAQLIETFLDANLNTGERLSKIETTIALCMPFSVFYQFRHHEICQYLL